VAVYEEQDGRRQQHNGGDGTSASSVGTSSPDIFQAVPSKTADASNQLFIWGYSIIGFGSGFTVNFGSDSLGKLNDLGVSSVSRIHFGFGFIVNPDPDPIIEYPLYNLYTLC